MSRSAIASPTVAGRALALAAAGLFLIGCGPSNGSASGGSGSSGPASPGTSTPAQSSGGGTALFPYAVGDTWVYEVSLGSSHGTTTNTVTAVKPVAGGNQVTFSSKENIPGLPSTPVTLSYVFHSDGSITTPFVQAGGGTVTLKSGSIVWPSQAVLDSGQPQHSRLVYQVHAAGVSTTVTANVTIKGDGTHSVTVPAGTYQATIVDESFNEKISGVSVATGVLTWLAPGVGPVKSELVSTTLGVSKPTSIDVLKSFTKG